jgi:ABC-2 type transport system ATP-binding protein
VNSQLRIDVQDLAHSYGDKPALCGVSLTVDPGEIVALLGPNGAGKTTLVETLAGFRKPTAGCVRVCGFDPTERVGRDEVRRRVGLVLQQTAHPKYLTVSEVLAMHASWYGHPRSLDDIVALVGLDGLEQRYVRELSGGEQRRLDVGVGLIGRPELVLLDEPTTGFDPVARRGMWEVIAGLREAGTSVLLTTHYMEEAQALADRVAFIDRGSIVAQGTPAEIATSLALSTRITFTLPSGIAIDAIPANVGAQAADGRRVHVQTGEPTRTLATLCSWAVDSDVELDDLAIEPPSLERSYLELATR